MASNARIEALNRGLIGAIMPPMLEKYGPYALIAGGSRGLGAAYAEALAKRGFNLLLVARRKEILEAFAAELRRKYAVTVITCAADLAGIETVTAFVRAQDREIGLLVYNAAHAPVGSFKDVPEEDLSRIAAINVRGPLLLSRLLLPAMVQRRRGGIVLMSSMAGSQGSARLAGYGASKSFNTILAEGLWEELRPLGIDVIACCAGAILTPGYAETQQGAAPGALAPEAVAEAALKALGKGPVVVPGGVNKLARFFLTRLMPRKMAVSVMAANTRSLQ